MTSRLCIGLSTPTRTPPKDNDSATTERRVVFKRRDPRPWWLIVARAIWPKGGWGRAAGYVGHRIRRLPDSPRKIGRGIFAGVFASFTPFFGLHFLTAALLAKLMRGNVLASLLGTFFGNPLTYVPIAMVSLKTGWLLMRRPGDEAIGHGIGAKFADAWSDLWNNCVALFSAARQADWNGLSVFWRDIFLPYLVGCVLPGVIASVVCYALVVPVISAYQNRRRKQLAQRLEKRLAEKRRAQLSAESGGT